MTTMGKQSAKGSAVTSKSSPSSPVPAHAPANPCSLRGHVEWRLGAKTIYCQQCKLDKPKGGWNHECTKLAQPRAWVGG
jgi:hypothetical protein